MTDKLTRKTFLLLTALSLTVCLLAYSCIWFFLPNADKNRARTQLEQKTGLLAKQLRLVPTEQGEALILEFIRETGAQVLLQDSQGQAVSFFVHWKEKETAGTQPEIRIPFRFADTDAEYVLSVRYHPSRTDEITSAVRRSMVFTATAILLLSFAGAWFFSRYTTRPIVRICQIAQKMAKLDFSWYCPDMRDDEIGMLSASINELSDKLHEALEELHRRNAGLEDEIQMEKERERRRMLFFSGISHELKTPVAIVAGQLEGMQAGIGVYRDRDKYLKRSAQILQSLNQFIREILLISKIDLAGEESGHPACISNLMEELLAEYAAYAEFMSISLHGNMEQNLSVYGEQQLLKKALGNIIGNAVTHSPEHAKVTISLYRSGKEHVILEAVNTPAHIPKEHLPHLFEAFYRADLSQGHGSGLGLYITRLILETWHVPHQIENTADGVRFTAVFQAAAGDEP